MFDYSSIAVPQVMSFGKCPFDQIWAEEEHIDPRSELMHVLQGRVEVEARDYRIVGEQGDTIYTPAAMPHRDVFAVGSVFEVYLIQFEWPGETEMLSTVDPVRLADISVPVKRQVAAEFHHLYQDLVSDLPFSRELLSLRLLQIIYRLRQDVASGMVTNDGHAGSARRVQLMNQAKRVIDRKFSGAITLEGIAAKLNISPYYLSHIFSQESGFTLFQYLRDVRMDNAAKLLADHRRNVTEVALAVGFTDPIYFRKVFKAHFGVSPKAYRAKLVNRS